MARCDAALEWLRDQRARYAAGEPVDAEAASYDPGEYLVLWDEATRTVQQLVELAEDDETRATLQRYLAAG